MKCPSEGRAGGGKEEGTLRGVGLFCLCLLCESKSALLPSKGQGTGLVEGWKEEDKERLKNLAEAH